MKRASRLACLVSLAFLLPLSLGALRPSQEGKAEPTIRIEPRTVILVRHAEKSAADDPEDPELSPEGKQRAEDLARLLARTGVTRLVASEFKRTQATLAPLAEQRKLTVDIRPAGELEALASDLASAAPGSVTVVCGHSNTIPGLAARLGVPLANLQETPQGPMLEDGEYNRLFVLYLPPASAVVRPTALELRYGR